VIKTVLISITLSLSSCTHPYQIGNKRHECRVLEEEACGLTLNCPTYGKRPLKCVKPDSKIEE
jgi:hypothetical protein